MVVESAWQTCPCGSDEEYATCCGKFHGGDVVPTPEALMRSRFSAFVQVREEYVRETWHPSTRPQNLGLVEGPEWTSLVIVSSDAQGDEGHVHFRAIYRLGKGWGCLEERSRFVREEGRWYYLAGDTDEGPYKPGRNDPCPCGSRRKFKACCL